MKDFNENEIIVIATKSFTHCEETKDGRLILNEGTIDRKDNIKIYVRSKEKSCHNIPHVHVWYNDYDNYCVISLINFELITPDNAKKRVVNNSIELIKENFDKCKIEWNKSDALIKI